jgi:hypothetical protein
MSVGNAAIIAVGDKAVLDSLASEGFSDEIVVTMDIHVPVVTVEAVASTPKLAIDSAHAMAEIVSQNVLSLQKAYGAPQGQLITTRSLDTGDNVQKVTSKVKRALAVIAGVGLLLTSAVTVGMDGFLRKRARRRAAKSADPGEPTSGAPAGAMAQTAPAPANGTGRHPAAGTAQPVPAGARSDEADTTSVLPANGGSPGSPAWSPVGDDATIVLPMPHKEQWAGRSKRR